MKKYSLKITKTYLYILIVLIGAISLLYTTWLLYSLYNIPFENIKTRLNIDVNKKLTSEQQIQLLSEIRIYKYTKLSAYVVNNIIIISFMIYTFITYKKEGEFGFVYTYSWIIIFIILASGPYLVFYQGFDVITMVLAILISVVYIFLVGLSIRHLIDLHIYKRSKLLEQYHSNKNF